MLTKQSSRRHGSRFQSASVQPSYTDFASDMPPASVERFPCESIFNLNFDYSVSWMYFFKLVFLSCASTAVAFVSANTLAQEEARTLVFRLHILPMAGIFKFCPFLSILVDDSFLHLGSIDPETDSFQSSLDERVKATR